MNKTIDYYFAPQSPWTYLGHARLAAMASAAQAVIRVLPADFGKVFAGSGGLPLPKRAPQRQAYRLQELARFRDHLKLPLNVQPRFFPVASDDAARLIIAVDLQEGADAAMRLSGAVFAAVWAQQRDIANADTLAELLSECGLPSERLVQSHTTAVQDRFDANTQAAIEAGVFGAPSYCIDGEIFWGQDRLDFVERKLNAGATK
ncbi:MAG: 2-hydroxychromene-2-carboxylate isomerase [Polaromonas sp.]|nr:2-hydroxychromene-2-carboxylate isomerase [Polaromonas sp.]